MKKLFAIYVVLCALAIAVLADSATVEWDAPTENSDGSPLTDGSHFTIYTSSNNVDWVEYFQTASWSVTTAVINYVHADFYVAVSASDTSGNESSLSESVHYDKLAPAPPTIRFVDITETSLLIELRSSDLFASWEPVGAYQLSLKRKEDG